MNNELAKVKQLLSSSSTTSSTYTITNQSLTRQGLQGIRSEYDSRKTRSSDDSFQVVPTKMWLHRVRYLRLLVKQLNRLWNSQMDQDDVADDEDDEGDEGDVGDVEIDETSLSSTSSLTSLTSLTSQPTLSSTSQSFTVKLTRGIKEIFLKVGEKAKRVTDSKNDLIITRDMMIGRYQVLSDTPLGKGTFGQVWLCQDTMQANKQVALKIVKSSPNFVRQAGCEYAVLEQLTLNNVHSAIRMQNAFMHLGHPCIAFDLLETNLYELLGRTQYGFSLRVIRKFARQLLLCLYDLSQLGIIHGDIKPENIMLCRPKQTEIQLIDFGSAFTEVGQLMVYVQSRYYRAPEVILRHRCYTGAIDMWSVACVLVELHTSTPLFAGHNELEMIQLMTATLGNPSLDMIQRGQKNYFTPNGELSQANKFPQTSLEKILEPTKTRFGHDDQTHQQFLDLIGKMLTWEPEQRLKPIDAIQHPFFE